MNDHEQPSQYREKIKYAYEEIPKIVLDYLNQKLDNQKFFPKHPAEANKLLEELGKITAQKITDQEKISKLDHLLSPFVKQKKGGSHLQKELEHVYNVLNGFESPKTAPRFMQKSKS